MITRILLPQPPFDAAIDPVVNHWNTGIMGTGALIALVYALWHWRHSGSATFLLLYLSGGAMMAFEAMVDTVGACWFPEINNWIAFHAYGRSLPVSLCLVYFIYFGIGVGVTWQLMRRGLSAQLIWGLFLFNFVNDFVLEAVLLHFGAYIYYGSQPLVVLKFPLWWGAVNALITMVGGAVVYRFESYLTQGWRQLQIIPVMLSVSAAVNAMAGWPSWLVINTDLGPIATQLGGIATFALSLWFMSMVVAVVTQTSAARNTGGSAPSQIIAIAR